MTAKQPFAIDEALHAVRSAVRGYPAAALFQLADEGYGSAFEILLACIISIRTRDETTLPLARRLFAVARTPVAIAALTPESLDALIDLSSFHAAKAQQIHTIARRVVDEFDGTLPCRYEVLTSFNGVGPKCANLVLGIACGEPRIGVDIHVHRVTNRWGYAHGTTPEATLADLESRLPVQYWVEINRLLVPFGKYICTGAMPHCSTCPVLAMCRQVGVTRHR